MADAELFRLGAVFLLAVVAGSLTYLTLVQRSLNSCAIGICLFNGWILWSSSARKVTTLDFPPEISSVSFETGLLITVILLLFWMLHVTKDQEGVSFVTDTKILSYVAITGVLYLLPFIFSYIANANDPPPVAQYIAVFLVWGWTIVTLWLIRGDEIIVQPTDTKVETAAD